MVPSMGEKRPPFRDKTEAERFIWHIAESDLIYETSERSYATRREARADADTALSEFLRRYPTRN
jgi:hypothetical protein